MSARYEMLAKWANKFGWTRGAELGLFDGRTFLYLLSACPKLALIGVDVWDMPGFTEGTSKSGERCFCRYCNETRIARRTLSVADMRTHVLRASAIYGPRAVVLQARTTEAASEIGEHSLDFVFVDGDHSTEGVFADIVVWHPKIQLGGRLIGHDWNLRSVRDAVLQIFSLAEVQTDDDHVWWVQC